MARLPPALAGLALPVIAAPMFIVSTPRLLVAQCRAGIVGSLPALSARPATVLEGWLQEIRQALADRPGAPFAVNLVAHRSNERLEQDLGTLVRHRVPIVITSLGARRDVNDAVHAYGGLVLHDVVNERFARKAVDAGADGLIAVAAGAGGHGGDRSPFALVQEIRRWFHGPLALAGAIATGRAILAAQAMGADFAYIGSAFIATEEAQADRAYQAAVVAGSSDDIVYTDCFSGVPANYLACSIRRAGLDPANLPAASGQGLRMVDGQSKPKAWKDIWGCGQGIGAIDLVRPAAEFIQGLRAEYVVAREALLRG